MDKNGKKSVIYMVTLDKSGFWVYNIIVIYLSK